VSQTGHRIASIMITKEDALSTYSFHLTNEDASSAFFLLSWSFMLSLWR
jgi:hypothetical protein